MKKLSLNELGAGGPTFLGDRVKGKKVTRGGLHIFKPGEVAHAGQRHVHDLEEVFIVLQGKAKLPINGDVYELKTGDVAIIQPGEDHHMTGDEKEPPAVVWLHVE